MNVVRVLELRVKYDVVTYRFLSCTYKCPLGPSFVCLQIFLSCVYYLLA